MPENITSEQIYQRFVATKLGLFCFADIVVNHGSVYLSVCSLLVFNGLSAFRLNEFAKKEKEKAELEEAHNAIESLIYDLSDKLTQDEFMVLI